MEPRTDACHTRAMVNQAMPVEPRPAQAENYSAEQLAAALSDMRQILANEPELGDFGYRHLRHAQLAEDRETISEPRSLAQFLATRQWLRRFEKRKTLNRKGSSYGLKHVAETDIGYMTNGVFIAAAIAEGFAVKRFEDTPNALLNITQRAWTRERNRG